MTYLVDAPRAGASECRRRAKSAPRGAACGAWSASGGAGLAGVQKPVAAAARSRSALMPRARK
jgi:hypothetical protein